LTSDKEEEYCEGEKIVRELTATDDEVPEPQRMRELVYVMTDQPENYQKTYTMLMKRVTDYRYNKHMEKGLYVVEYLLKNGDERFVKSCKSHVEHFEKLRGYKYEMYGKDYGAEVRKRANRVAHYLTHDSELQAAREEALGLPPKKKEQETEKKKETGKSKAKAAAKKEEEEEEVVEEEEEVVEEEEEQEREQEPEAKAPEDVKAKKETTTKKTKEEHDMDPWLKDFSPEDKQAANEDGGKYTFGDFDKYEEPFEEK